MPLACPSFVRDSKIAQIEFYGVRAHPAESPAAATAEAKRLAAEAGGHFMDQFTYAERATDWRGNNNIAESIFEQMRETGQRGSLATLLCDSGMRHGANYFDDEWIAAQGSTRPLRPNA
nr:hypothetical protein [Glycomyces sp. L485]